MRRWRERHPLLAVWHNHLGRARQRGIAVLWSLDEFADFCFATGYLILRRSGWEIDRRDAREGYSLENCRLLPKPLNARKGNHDKLRLRAAAGR
jgi:hypothetical protein